jgi:hypothetical protein
LKITIDSSERTFDPPNEGLELLDESMTKEQAEIWLSFEPDGPRMAMFRNFENAFLMYLKSPDDSGMVSFANAGCAGLVDYCLSNGQQDQYPASWSIPVSLCAKAIRQFVHNHGEQPECVTWVESLWSG